MPSPVRPHEDGAAAANEELAAEAENGVGEQVPGEEGAGTLVPIAPDGQRRECHEVEDDLVEHRRVHRQTRQATGTVGHARGHRGGRAESLGPSGGVADGFGQEAADAADGQPGRDGRREEVPVEARYPRRSASSAPT